MYKDQMKLSEELKRIFSEKGKEIDINLLKIELFSKFAVSKKFVNDQLDMYQKAGIIEVNNDIIKIK